MSRKPKAAAVETTHKAELELGPGVVNGRLLWTSASGLTKIDTNSTGGCARRWWFEQVLGKRQPSTEAQRKGTKLHSEIEGHLIEGKPLLTALANSGRHYIPEAGPGLLIEQGIARATPEGIASWLSIQTSAGLVAVAGHVDIWNHRGIYIDREGELKPEPRPNTLETKDWKTTSNLVYAKTAAELAQNVQMVTYSEVGFRAWPHLEHGRLTHVYFRTRGAAVSDLVTTLCDREQIGRRWEYVEGLGRLAADVAREMDPEKVPANRNACSAYGGCPHQAYCSVGSHDSLSEVFGPRGAEQVIARMRGQPLNQENPHMALTDKLNPSVVAAAQAGTMIPQPAAPVATLPAAQGVGVAVSMAPAIDAEVARIQAEETARRAQQAAGIPVGFAEALGALRASGYGFPTFVGRAASAVAAQFTAWGHAITLQPGQELTGVGWLSERVKQPVEDPSLVLQLAAEVATLPPLQQQQPAAVAPPPPPVMITPPPAPVVPPPSMLTQAPAPIAAPTVPMAISVLPPDAPASNPALAAQPVEGFDNAKARELAALQNPPIPGLQATAQHVAMTGQLPQVTPPPSLLGTPPAAMPVASLLVQQTTAAPAAVSPPPAPATVPDAQTQVVATTPRTEQATTTTSRRGPGRPRGPRVKKTTTTQQVGDVSITNSTETTDDTDTGIYIYVNCAPSFGFDRLETYIDRVNATLCAEYQATDVQCGPKDGPLGFQKWPGAVRGLARKVPPEPGHYVVRTSGNDLAAVVIDALRAKVEESGGHIVEPFSW